MRHDIIDTAIKVDDGKSGVDTNMKVNILKTQCVPTSMYHSLPSKNIFKIVRRAQVKTWEERKNFYSTPGNMMKIRLFCFRSYIMKCSMPICSIYNN